MKRLQLLLIQHQLNFMPSTNSHPVAIRSPLVSTWIKPRNWRSKVQLASPSAQHSFWNGFTISSLAANLKMYNALLAELESGCRRSRQTLPDFGPKPQFELPASDTPEIREVAPEICGVNREEHEQKWFAVLELQYGTCIKSIWVGRRMVSQQPNVHNLL